MVNRNLPRIKSVAPGKPYTLKIVWQDGSRSTADLTGLFHRLKIFAPLIREPARFANVKIVAWGTAIAWSDEMEYPAAALREIAEEHIPMSGESFSKMMERMRVNVDEVAKLLGVSARTVRDARQRAELPTPWTATLRRCEKDPTFFAALYKPVHIRPPGRPKAETEEPGPAMRRN